MSCLFVFLRPRHLIGRWQALAILGCILFAIPAAAQDRTPLEALIRQLPEGSYAERAQIIDTLAKTGDTALVPVFEALRGGDLNVLIEDGRVVIASKSPEGLAISDAVSGKALGVVAVSAIEKVKVNNLLRREIDSALARLTLSHPDPERRRLAARNLLSIAGDEMVAALETALAAETDPAAIMEMSRSRALLILGGSADLGAKTDALASLAPHDDRDTLGALATLASGAQPELRPLIEARMEKIERSLALWTAGQNVWYGLSLGSVLLLAAIGLAITFGVMGVINMAHGEIVMLGAYTTFTVQEVIRTTAPALFDYSLAISLPLAFLVSGLAGIAIERGIIRLLYGRPLETLLATWGLSLVLQQTVRTIFGPNNREVGNPAWMSGAFELGGLAITWNRLWILVFALIVFAALLLLLKKTSLGLQMRAVTQNRRMASSMGIKTPWVDALTFGLGSGIAGIAGVALSQIDNVSPNLGQGYIIDSFMVVVFGGVGNLWGTLIGALTLGITNKFLEPYAGAVLGKIFILVFIILFIQRRPRGIFALKGRAVE